MELCINSFNKMLLIYYYIICLITNIEASKLSSVGAKSAIKRETNVRDILPLDLLPSKIQNEDIGELKQVVKNKVKKRLAPPMNFMLRAVEPEGDDYYDKTQGDSDNDDYYEKKEWSDLNTQVEVEDKEKPVNHTEISEIDGVVNIIVGGPKHIAGAPTQKIEIKKLDEKTEPEKIKTKVIPDKVKPNKYEDDVDYEESDSEKHKPGSVEYEQNDSEAKKAGILDSVDELKERHTKEQKLINEKLKEEEMNIEEQERDKIKTNIFTRGHDKYDDRHKAKNLKKISEYDEYEDKTESSEEKNIVTPAGIITTTRLPARTHKRRGKKQKQVETGKLSVFKNPKLFMVYDDDLEETSSIRTAAKVPSKSRSNKKAKYSASYTTTPSNVNENERISLLPAEIDGKEGEPTLFFPKRRKNKKRTKSKTTVRPPIDSIVAETVAANQGKKLTTVFATDTTVAATDATSANTDLTDTTAVTGPTGVGPASSAPITDAVAASTDHKTEKKNENYDREKGTEKHYHASHEEESHEEGKKAYEGLHEETKTAEGHHDKENHLGKYDDHGHMDKHHEEESGHYGSHEHEEHGKKHAKYEESGKHSKGHSTKGSHDIHKKEEYEKKVEFFEEEGDSGEDEKTGGYHQEKGHSEGGHYKKADYKAGDEEHSKGESGHSGHGGLLHVSKGHKASEGYDNHGRHGNEKASKGGKGSGKKWLYHHGYPAKTANLVRIDRRAEKYYHGPRYFG